MPITATFTAETLLLVVNKRTNSTRSSTILNTEIDLGDYTTPATVDSAGTVTTSVILRVGTTNSTRYIAYPTTAYEDYPSTYSPCGTVATTVDGTATRLTYQNGCDVTAGVTRIINQAPTFTYSSHPPFPEGVQDNVDLIQDPRGWTFTALVDAGCDDANILSPLFQDLGLWSCTGAFVCVSPNEIHNTALLLTATSTSIEADIPTPVSAKKSSPTPVAPIATSIQHPVIEQTTGSVRLINPKLSNLPSPLPPVTPTPPSPPSPLRPTSLARSEYAGPVALATANALAPEFSSTPGDSSLTVTTLPVVVSAPDAEGSTAITESATVPIPILITITNAQGPIVYSESLSTAPVAALTLNLVSSTNADGILISSASYVPAIVPTKTDAEGSQVLTTSALLPATVFTTTNAQGSQILTTSAIPLAIPRPPALTLDTQTTTPNSLGQYVVNSQILTPGGAITASGTIISLSSDGTEAVVGTSTEKLNSHFLPNVISPPVFTIGTQAITANSLGQYVIGSQTLTPGGVITASGTRISLAADVSNVTSSEGLGGYILGGFGNVGGSNGTGVQPFTGDADGRHKRLWIETMLCTIVFAMLIWL